MPLSTTFHVYIVVVSFIAGENRLPEYPEKTTDLQQVT